MNKKTHKRGLTKRNHTVAKNAISIGFLVGAVIFLRRGYKLLSGLSIGAFIINFFVHPAADPSPIMGLVAVLISLSASFFDTLNHYINGT